MATEAKPPIIETAIAGWRDAFAAIAAMPVTAGIAFAVLLVVGVLSVLLLPAPGAPGGAGAVLHVAGIVSSIIQSFLVAPLAIAVHRYVLLGEVASGYALDPSNPRYLRFVGFAVAINLLMMVPNLIFAVLPHGTENAAVTIVGSIVGLVLLIVLMIVALRRAILFPAIAVDAAGATWTNARNDTKGHSWRVLFIFVCTAIPVMVVSIPLYWVLLKPPGGTTGGHLLFSLISTVVQVPTICAFAAVASHIFRTLADNLARPAGAPA